MRETSQELMAVKPSLADGSRMEADVTLQALRIGLAQVDAGLGIDAEAFFSEMALLP
ncbi:MAG: hypothetical protein HQL97_08195 [Magnetococcales bacterium]|nr:hypothetical protein [Magnetococcales bacterium]